MDATKRNSQLALMLDPCHETKENNVVAHLQHAGAKREGEREGEKERASPQVIP